MTEASYFYLYTYAPVTVYATHSVDNMSELIISDFLKTELDLPLCCVMLYPELSFTER